jgi:hypothetical protein
MLRIATLETGVDFFLHALANIRPEISGKNMRKRRDKN